MMSFKNHINPEGEFKWGRLETSIDDFEKKNFTKEQLKKIKEAIKRIVDKAFKADD
jgi:hypothetical protein